LLHRRIVVLTVLTWMPLLALSAVQGHAWGGRVALPFLSDIELHVRLLLAVPLLGYVLYPPEVKQGSEVPAWATQELQKMGPLSRREMLLGLLVMIALALWIFADDFLNATTAALVVICLMLLTRVVSWDEMLANKQAWNTLAWFATLVALADGLSRTGFVKWFADTMAAHMSGFSPTIAAIVLVLIFFFTHYMFASVTAHATAMLPVMLTVGSTIPGMPMQSFALLLALTLGIMGIVTPYGTGPSPVYFGSGYLPAADYWRLGAIFGVIYIGVFLLLGAPFLL